MPLFSAFGPSTTSRLEHIFKYHKIWRRENEGLILSHAFGWLLNAVCLKTSFCKSNPELVLCLSHCQFMLTCIRASHMVENLQEKKKIYDGIIYDYKAASVKEVTN